MRKGFQKVPNARLQGKTKIEAIITCHINDYPPFPKKQLFPIVKKQMYRNVEPQKIYQGLLSRRGTLGRRHPSAIERFDRGDDVRGVWIDGNEPHRHRYPLGRKDQTGDRGVPVPNTDVKIVDVETGTEEMKQGLPGEVIIKGPQVMKGYYKKPEETAAVLKDGWLFTGDIGFFDEDGYLTIVDRKKDMIIASGYNIYPREIDEILFDHPKVLEACSIGVFDEYRGETVKAYVVVKPGEALSEEEIVRYCQEKLAAYKVPKMVEFIDALPKSAIGKILRREVKEMDRKKKGGDKT